MTEVHDLRKLYYDEGKNITEIAKQTGRDRKTVRQSLHKEDWNEPQVQTLAGAYPKLDPFKAEIDSWLMDDKKAKRKQRHTAQRVYDRLVEAHTGSFNCSYRTVVAYVGMKRKEIYGKRAGILAAGTYSGGSPGRFWRCPVL